MSILPRRRKRTTKAQAKRKLLKKKPRKKVVAKKTAPKKQVVAKKKVTPKKPQATTPTAVKPAGALPAAPVSGAKPAPIAVVDEPLPTPAPVVVPVPGDPAPAAPSTPATPTAPAGPTTAPTTPTTPAGPTTTPTTPSTPTTPTTPGVPPASAIPFGRAEAERLLWRAGFGPRPGDVARVAAMGLDAAVDALVHPSGAATLVGPEPHDQDGGALAPQDIWGHDAVWWFDRMVRTNQPLVERMTLVWHDWFANSREKVDSASLMLAQNALFRRHALGSFADLLRDITHDPAMLLFLDGVENQVGSPNENYAREIMELFTLGAGRGAYTEDDVRELARAFTGYDVDWVEGVGLTNFRYVASRHDSGSKTVFGRTGRWTIDDGWRLCVEHPLHASYFVTKLWSAFIPTAPSAATVTALSAIYTGSGHQIAPVVAAILKHPDLYTGPRMVKAPVVYAAGVLRETNQYVTTDWWSWLLPGSGQQLFYPPNVAGWDEARWLDTNTWRGRWSTTAYTLDQVGIDPWGDTPYSATETPEQALTAALAFFGDPTITTETRAALRAAAANLVPSGLPAWEQSPQRAMRQNALRLLIATCADHQTS